MQHAAAMMAPPTDDILERDEPASACHDADLLIDVVMVDEKEDEEECDSSSLTTANGTDDNEEQKRRPRAPQQTTNTNCCSPNHALMAVGSSVDSISEREGETMPLLAVKSASPTSSSSSSSSLADSTRKAQSGHKRNHATWNWLRRHGLTLNNLIVIVATILLILSWTANSVSFKMLTNAMPNYPLFLAQMRVICFLPIYWAMVLFRRDRWSFGDPDSDIMLAKGNVAKWKFLIMGIIDSGAGLLMVFGGNHTPGPLQSLLYQASIPVTMLATVIFLRRRYRVIQYAGASVILVGVVVSLFPALIGVSESTTDLIWNFVFLSSILPTALSSVFKEYCFRKQPIDIWVLSAWVTLFQTIAGFVLAPLTALPSHISVLDLPANMWDGCKCLVGINSQPSDSCAGAWIYVSGYMLINLLFNVFTLIVLKRGSATLVYISSAVRLPLANFAFTLHFIMGDRASDLNIWIVAGLVVILLGLVIYKFTFSIPYLDDLSWMPCYRCCRSRAKGWTEDDCLGYSATVGSSGGDATPRDSFRIRELNDWQFIYVMDSQQMVSWAVRSRSRSNLHFTPRDYHSSDSAVDRFVRAANTANTI